MWRARSPRIVKDAKRRVAVTIFASNVARLRAVADAARGAGRHLVVAGRAMHRIIDVAIATGYLPQDFKYYDQSHFSHLAPHEVVALCTGSQGEPRAALARISVDEHPDIKLDPGDLVVFSSRTIPGNERAVGQIQNRLIDMGCELITDADALVHVTGHPRREELKEIYGLGQAQGRHPHARRGAAPGRACQTGAGVRHQGGALDQKRRHGAAGAGAGGEDRRGAGGPPVPRWRPAGAERGRPCTGAAGAGIRRAWSLSLCRALDARVIVPDPEIVLDGVPDADAEGRAMEDIVRDAVEGTIASIPRDRRRDPELVREAVRRAVRAAVGNAWGKRPIVKVLLTRVPR